MALFSEEDWEALRRIASFGGTFVLGRPQCEKLVAALEEAERKVQAASESALGKRIAELQDQLVAMDAKLLDASPEIARLRDQLALRPKVVELELGATWDHDEAAPLVVGQLLNRVLHDARRFAEVVDAVDGLGSRTLTVRLLVVDLRQAVATAGAEFRAGQAVYLDPDGLVRP